MIRRIPLTPAPSLRDIYGASPAMHKAAYNKNSPAVMKKLSLAIALSLGVALSGCDSDATKAKGNQEQATQHSERADNYLRQGQYRAAIIEARNAIKLSPNEPRHSVMMARALNDVGQFKAAAQELEDRKSTRLNSSHVKNS